jgi:hypothetical protein
MYRRMTWQERIYFHLMPRIKPVGQVTKLAQLEIFWPPISPAAPLTRVSIRSPIGN